MTLCWHCLEHHDSYECHAFGELNLPRTFFLDHFDTLTPMRVLLLLRQSYQSASQEVSDVNGSDRPIELDFDEILSMESHCSVRRNTLIWDAHAKNVVKPLREFGIMTAMNEGHKLPCTIDDDFVQKICGILDVNTFEVRTPNFEVSEVNPELFTNSSWDLRRYLCRSFQFEVSIVKRLFWLMIASETHLSRSTMLNDWKSLPPSILRREK